MSQNTEENLGANELTEQEIIDASETLTENLSLEKAIEVYKKIQESKNELNEKELEELEKTCDKIRDRKIIDIDTQHTPTEIDGDGKIITGPPTLTRFEKARIMGSRALQLSLGAPPFINIPKSTATSLDLAMKELDERVIPITIRRSLPNGDYQNIPITDFK